MQTRFGSALVLGFGITTLAACGGGSGGGDPSPRPVTPPVAGPVDPASPGVPAVDEDDEFKLDTTPIRTQLDPETLRRVSWGSSTPAIEPDGTWKTYDADTTWNWQLQGEIRTDYVADVYVLDLFAQLDGSVQNELHAKDRDALCYFSVGTYEPWRPDEGFFTAEMKGNPHVGYPDELWLDVTNPEVVRIMVNRLDMARAIGCDGVELDNVDGYQDAAGVGNDSGFSITKPEQIEYSRILANEAHRRGLSVALKNGPLILAELEPWFDLSINEECFQYQECGLYAPMVDAGKPVFNAEYKLFTGEGATREEVPATSVEGRAALCEKADAANIRATLLPLALDGSFRFACD